MERWTLCPGELALLSNKAGHTRLGFAVMLGFFAGEGRFPRDKCEVPMEALRLVGVARRLFRSKHPHREAGARLAPYPRRRPTPGLRPGLGGGQSPAFGRAHAGRKEIVADRRPTGLPRSRRSPYPARNRDFPSTGECRSPCSIGGPLTSTTPVSRRPRAPKWPQVPTLEAAVEASRIRSLRGSFRSVGSGETRAAAGFPGLRRKDLRAGFRGSRRKNLGERGIRSLTQTDPETGASANVVA